MSNIIGIIQEQINSDIERLIDLEARSALPHDWVDSFVNLAMLGANSVKEAQSQLSTRATNDSRVPGLLLVALTAQLSRNIECDKAFNPLTDKLSSLGAAIAGLYHSDDFSKCIEKVFALYRILYQLLNTHTIRENKHSKDMLALVSGSVMAIDEYLNSVPLVSSTDFLSTLQNAIDSLNKEYLKVEKKAKVVSTRTLDAEVGAINVEQARHLIDTLIEECFSDTLCPVFLSSFVLNTLKGELQFLKAQPQSHSFYQRWNSMLRDLGQVLREYNGGQDEGDRDDQILYSLIPSILKQLELLERPQTISVSVYQEFLDLLNQLLMQILRGEGVEVCPFPSVRSRPDSLAPHFASRVTADAYRPQSGQWYCFNTPDLSRQVGLLTIDERLQGYLLFVDQQGFKLRLETDETFKELLSMGLAYPIALSIPLDKIARHLAKVTLAAQNFLQDALSTAEREEAEKARKEAEETLRQEEARRLAAEKARKEAEEIALAKKTFEEKLKREQQALAEQQREERNTKATELLSSLQVGTEVDIRLPSESQSIRCKLSVLIPSTERYIFTNGIGVKVAELHRQELYDLCLMGVVDIKGQVSSFESQLERVVTGIKSKSSDFS